jgi:hypothetical protein
LSERRAREPELLDAIDLLPRVSYSGRVWRVVREGREPLQLSHVGGRWDIGITGGTGALYTSLDPDGAIAEIEFRLRMEPVFPSRYRAILYELNLDLEDILRFETLEELRPLGVDLSAYQTVLYNRTQQIGDAAQFLGLKGLIAPNARWACLNLVIYALDPNAIQIVERGPIDWQAWRSETRVARRSKGEPK